MINIKSCIRVIMAVKLKKNLFQSYFRTGEQQGPTQHPHPVIIAITYKNIDCKMYE